MSSGYSYGADDSMFGAGVQQYGNFECDEPSPRGEYHTPLVSIITRSPMRIGFMLQTVSLIGMMLSYLLCGGRGLYVYDIYAGPEEMRISGIYHMIMISFTLLHLAGVISLALFQVFVADNSKFSRGFRMGSKLLSRGVVLDSIATGMRLVLYLYTMQHMNLRWWAKYRPMMSEWSVFQYGNLIHAISLLHYGLGAFYLESYHDVGTFEEYGWLVMILFIGAGLAEILRVFVDTGMFLTVIILSAYIASVVWSSQFEPLLERYNPVLHSRELNADVLPDKMPDNLYQYQPGTQ